jgi:hypothetical protein
MTRSKFRQQVFVGKDVTNSLAAIPPQSNDGTLINGIAIDRRGAMSALVVFAAAAATGTPDSAVALITVEDNTVTTAGTFVAYKTLVAALNVDPAGKCEEYMINLEGASRYIRVSVDITYVGGTTPANIVCANVVLGDYDVEPKIAQTVL